MKYAFAFLSAVGAVSAQTIAPYGQCGGLTWRYLSNCEAGTTCTPVGTNAFPNYQCYPNSGPIVAHVFPYGQCGGQGYTGPTLCPPGWACSQSNTYFSQCLSNSTDAAALYDTPTPTPELANPGAFCGSSAAERSYPGIDCVPGFKCSGPGVYGYYVCLKDTSAPTTTAPPSVPTPTTRVVSTTLAITLSR